MKELNFSVLMPVYYRDSAEHFAEALYSVIDIQSVKPTEVVIVKDGPLTVELDAVCDRYVELYGDLIKIVALPENVGLGSALNIGLNHCTYDLVARMDSDDISKYNRFEKQLAIFERDSRVSVVGSWVDEFEGCVDNIISIRKLPERHDELRRYAASRCPLNHPSVMFRKGDIESVGGYKHFYLFEDYYLWMRLLKAGCSFYNIQQSLLYFRTNPHMIRRRGGWKYARSEAKFFGELRRMGVISGGSMVRSMIIRFPIRIMPNQIRAVIYRKLLR